MLWNGAATKQELKWCIIIQMILLCWGHQHQSSVYKASDTPASMQRPRSSLAPEKQEGPSTSITFLGIVIATTCQELCLPPEKLNRLYPCRMGKKKNHALKGSWNPLSELSNKLVQLSGSGGLFYIRQSHFLKWLRNSITTSTYQ